MNAVIDPREILSQPLTQASALPAWFYIDPEAMALEKRAVFSRGWQLLSRVALLDGRGDHVVSELADVPLLLVRGDDGGLRALHNVCRHRAGPLATCDGRGARHLRCQYHGWCYDLKGQLLTATEMGAAEGFDAGGIRLPEARAVEWHGLVFACLDPDAPPFEDVVAAIEPRLAGKGIDAYKLHRHVAYDINCNWKAYIDNYLEGYHVPHIHPELNRMLDYRDYTVETARWTSLQHSPLDSGEVLYGAGEALYWYLWPNTMLNVMPGRMQTNRVLPLGPQRCRVEFDYYYPRDADPLALEERHRHDHEFSDLVQHQDVEMCERVQRGLASGSYHAGRLNPQRENGVHHFHELLREAYRQGDQRA
ncbi:MAG TPA: aromatic ring-hydroxylating dioxygenase subunit alpha [Rhodanobacteraceae bacterium]|nr:aromatic ring-hydroxylating dioxygenase subunit alpha [Rhodanobacteraceae bacterium]